MLAGCARLGFAAWRTRRKSAAVMKILQNKIGFLDASRRSLSVKPCGISRRPPKWKKDVARQGFDLGDADLGCRSEVLFRDNGCVCPNRDMGFE
jgi:hypothetical protein